MVTVKIVCLVSELRIPSLSKTKMRKGETIEVSELQLNKSKEIIDYKNRGWISLSYQKPKEVKKDKAHTVAWNRPSKVIYTKKQEPSRTPEVIKGTSPTLSKEEVSYLLKEELESFGDVLLDRFIGHVEDLKSDIILQFKRSLDTIKRDLEKASYVKPVLMQNEKGKEFYPSNEFDEEIVFIPSGIIKEGANPDIKIISEVSEQSEDVSDALKALKNMRKKQKLGD